MVNFADAEPIFPEFLTGWEMISLFAKVKGAFLGQEEFFIEDMKMQGYLNNPLGTYSSGMLKKLSLVLAFLGHPKLILLDEPLITMDNESLCILYNWVEHKHREENISFLLSSHQKIDIKAMSNIQEVLIEQQTLKHTLNTQV